MHQCEASIRVILFILGHVIPIVNCYVEVILARKWKHMEIYRIHHKERNILIISRSIRLYQDAISPQYISQNSATSLVLCKLHVAHLL